MRRTIVFALFVVVIAIPAFAAGTIKGRVKLIDENGSERPKPNYSIPGLNKIRLFEVSGDTEKTCIDLPLSGASLETQSRNRDKECFTRPLLAQLVMQTRVAGWVQKPMPVKVDPCTETSCDFTIKVEWPKNPPAAIRAENFENAMKPGVGRDTSLFLLTEAAADGDLHYTYEAMEFLEKQGRKKDVVRLVEATGIEEKLQDPDNLFRLKMRYANAKLAAGAEPEEVLPVVAEAQLIEPQSKVPASLGITAIKYYAGSDLRNVVTYINSDPQVKTSFTEIFQAWDVDGKPPVTDVYGNVTRDAVAFTIKKNPRSF